MSIFSIMSDASKNAYQSLPNVSELKTIWKDTPNEFKITTAITTGTLLTLNVLGICQVALPVIVCSAISLFFRNKCLIEPTAFLPEKVRNWLLEVEGKASSLKVPGLTPERVAIIRRIFNAVVMGVAFSAVWTISTQVITIGLLACGAAEIAHRMQTTKP